MSGQGRSGDEGVRPDLVGKLDFDAPMPKHERHYPKRGFLYDGTCGAFGVATTTEARFVDCPKCKKLLVRRGKLAA